LALVLALCPGVPAVPAQALPAQDTSQPEGFIGIRLLEAPTNRSDDPRARVYIVDHLAPGVTIRRRIQVVNKSSEEHRIGILAGAAAVEEHEFRFVDDPAGNELTSWISFDKEVVDLEPWSDDLVTATIQVPATATAGERYAVIWAAVKSAPSNKNISTVHRVGIRIYLGIGPGGEPRSDFEIGSLTTARASDGRPSLDIAVRNTGGRAVDLSGTVMLSGGPAGAVAGPFEVTRGTTLLPGGAGSVTVAFPADLPNGPWTAALTLASGNVRRAVTATITFPDPGQPGFTTFLHGSVTTLSILGGGVAITLLTLVALAVVARRNRGSHRRSTADKAPARGLS
jgi:hypothetical protein